MVFEVRADPATIKVMKECAKHAEKETAEFNAFVEAFTELIQRWSDAATAEEKL